MDVHAGTARVQQLHKTASLMTLAGSPGMRNLQSALNGLKPGSQYEVLAGLCVKLL